jgi:hypothetical protein
MTSRSHRGLGQAYLRLTRQLSHCLWTVDPEFMGSKVQGPSDEYDEAADLMVKGLLVCRSRVEVEQLFAAVYAEDAADLVDCAWLALSDYRREQT